MSKIQGLNLQSLFLKMKEMEHQAAAAYAGAGHFESETHPDRYAAVAVPLVDCRLVAAYAQAGSLVAFESELEEYEKDLVAESLAAVDATMDFGCPDEEDIGKVAATANIAVSENPHLLYSANQPPTWPGTAD